MAEIEVGVKVKVPYGSKLISATIKEIEPLFTGQDEEAWAIHLIGDPPNNRVAVSFPLYGKLEKFTVAQIETAFAKQLKEEAEFVKAEVDQLQKDDQEIS